jgi:hypothetical protein
LLVQEENGAPQSPVNPLSDLYAVLEGSALIPFLESKLQANSFLEIGRHTSVYRMVIGIIRELCLQSSLVSLLGPLPDQTASIHSLLQNLETQARIMISRIGGFHSKWRNRTRNKKFHLSLYGLQQAFYIERGLRSIRDT